jgi:type II secretory pathway component PulJ
MAKRLRDFRPTGEGGQTLVELSIVVGLLGIVLVPIFMFMFSVQRGEARISHANTQDTGARLAVERLSRALREANYPEGHDYTDSALFDTIGATDLRMYGDSDNDGSREKSRFYLTGKTLYKMPCNPTCTAAEALVNPGNPLITDVQNGIAGTCGRASGVTQPMFTYYSKDLGGGPPIPVDPTTDIDKIVDIYQVTVNIQVREGSVNAPACQTLVTTVQLRNKR